MLSHQFPLPARTGLLLSVVVGVLSVGACGLTKPPPPKDGGALRAVASNFSASNGFRVFVLPDPSARVVRLEVRYDIGAAHDPPGKEGLAHLVEHLMFQTRLPTRAGPVSVQRELSRVALGHNAYTNLDSTHFQIQALPGRIDRLFALEMARLGLGCSTWTEEIFAREREVVRNEIRRNYQTPAGVIPTLVNEVAYPPGHPYRRSVGGTDVTLASIELADACAFVERYYTPAHATILAVGNTTEGEVRGLAEKWLSQFPVVTREPSLVYPAVVAGRRKVVERELDIDSPQILVALPLPSDGTPDGRIARLAVPLVIGRLQQFAARYHFADNAFATISGGRRAPLLVIGVELPNAGDRTEAIDFIWKAIDGVADEFHLDDSGDRAQRWIGEKSELIARFERLSARGSMFADYAQFDTTETYLVGRLEELDELDWRDVGPVARRVFDADRASAVFVRPRKGAGAYLAGAFGYDGSTEVDDLDPGPLLDPAEADRPLELPAYSPPFQPVRYRLSKGLHVILWPSAAALPLVHTRLLVHSGTADDPRGKEGLAEAAGGHVERTTTVWGGVAVSSFLHRLIKRMSMRLRLHQVRDFDDWRASVRRTLKQPRAARAMAFDAAFRTALYGADHPYARPEMTADSVGRIDGDGVVGFQRSHHTGGNATLIVTGQFDEALMRKHIEYQLGHLGGKRHDERAVPNAPAPRIHFVAGVGDARSPVASVTMGWTAGRGVDATYATRRVLERVLDAHLAKLRQDRALTYGIYARYQAQAGPGAWTISGQVDAARTAEAVTELRATLASLRASPERLRAELVLARRHLVQELLTNSTSGAAVADVLLFMETHGLPDAFPAQLLNAVARVTLADVHAVLVAELDPERAVLGLLGPPNAVAAARAATTAPITGADEAAPGSDL